MFNTTTERIATLTKEITMLSNAQPHLKGVQARLNVGRIASRVEELETLTAVANMEERFGAAEIARCEQEAARG